MWVASPALGGIPLKLHRGHPSCRAGQQRWPNYGNPAIFLSKRVEEGPCRPEDGEGTPEGGKGELLSLSACPRGSD